MTTEERLRTALEMTASTVREDKLRQLRPPRRAARRWRGVAVPLAAALAVLLIVGVVDVVARTGGPAGGVPAGGGVSRSPMVHVGGLLNAAAVDAPVGTLYLASSMPDQLLVISTATCRSIRAAQCVPVAKISLGGMGYVNVAVNERTQTVYATNSRTGVVEVIDAATCNASTVTGCSSKPVLVRVPGEPVALAVDANTNTIYVGSYRGDVSVINADTCDAEDTSGCPKRPASLKVGPVMRAIAVDPATGTVYAATAGRVAIVDVRGCGGPAAGTCAKLLRTIPVGQEPTGIAVDAAANAIYVSNAAGTVTALNRSNYGTISTRCTAQQRPPAGSIFIAELDDPASHTLYLTTLGSGPKVSMINTTTYGAAGAGCGTRMLSFAVGTADELAADPGTHTVYVANAGNGTLALVNDMTCNATDTRGCPTSR